MTFQGLEATVWFSARDAGVFQCDALARKPVGPLLGATRSDISELSMNGTGYRAIR